MTKRRHLRKQETADRLDVPVGTLKSWMSRGVAPPYYKLNGVLYWDPDELDAWVAARRVAPEAA